jgi:hypothetical protein
MATPVETIKQILASSVKLAESDPQDEAVARAVKGLESQVSILRDQMKGSRSWSKDSMQSDIDSLGNQISRLKKAAEIPAKNWKQIVNITEGLHRAAIIASQPQNHNPETISKLKEITAKVAGLFQEIDTTDDMAGKSLSEIEAAVAKLYGDQSNNKSFYGLSNRGHHTKKDLSKE